jgi:transglutaminase-like putative cysteine protease
MKKMMVLWGMLGVVLAFGISVVGCGTLTNVLSPPYAIDKNGQLFRAKYTGLGIDINIGSGNNQKNLLGQGILIDGVKYPSFMEESTNVVVFSPEGSSIQTISAQEENAIHNSIYPNAPKGWTSYIPGKFLIYMGKPNYTPPLPPEPVPVPPRPKVQPTQYPTITPEELEKVELAYTETIRDIERRGKNLEIRNAQERAAFIQRYQGKPNTAVINPLKKEIFPNAAKKYYNSYHTSEKEIVALARNEPNDFRKVRMIHDWVSDIFSYDHDLLWWMDNISGQNAVFTLGEIVKRERGVCLEYAILFYFLMDEAGIDTYLISDYSKPGIGHAYNMVVIDGTGYIIDTTWDSPNKYGDGKIIEFSPPCTTEYFMLGISESYKERGW